MFVSLICTSLILILYSSMSPSCSENLAILAFLGESSFDGFYNLTGQNKEEMCDNFSYVLEFKLSLTSSQFPEDRATHYDINQTRI